MNRKTGVYENNPIGPATILPSQLYSAVFMLPEQRLMLAVLKDAVRIYLRHKNRDSQRVGRLSREEQWFQSTDATRLFSFENICMALDIDAETVRRRLFGHDSIS